MHRPRHRARRENNRRARRENNRSAAHRRKSISAQREQRTPRGPDFRKEVSCAVAQSPKGTQAPLSPTPVSNLAAVRPQANGTLWLNQATEMRTPQNAGGRLTLNNSIQLEPTGQRTPVTLRTWPSWPCDEAEARACNIATAGGRLWLSDLAFFVLRKPPECERDTLTNSRIPARSSILSET